MYKYLLALIPFILADIYFLIRYKNKKKEIFLSLIPIVVLVIIWDLIASRIFNLWYWNEAELIGRFLGLPIEDYFLIIFGSVFIIGAYETIKEFIEKK